MIRKKAIEACLNNIGNSPIVAANGFISRDLFNVKDKKTNFYMIGSMGLASSIGLGVALKNKNKKIFVLDGDGNILMNLGSLTTIGTLKPQNLVHFVLDNESHESTGGQPTHSNKIQVEKIAQVSNYTVFKIKKVSELEIVSEKIKTIKNPIMILIKISGKSQIGKRIEIKPEEIINC